MIRITLADVRDDCRRDDTGCKTGCVMCVAGGHETRGAPRRVKDEGRLCSQMSRQKNSRRAR
jgi:hypothetical protein